MLYREIIAVCSEIHTKQASAFCGQDVEFSVLNLVVEASWNVMAHAQKPYFVFRAKRTSPFKSAGGVRSVDYWQLRCCASAVVMLDTPCSEVVWRVLAIHSIRQFPLHFPSLASPCAITFQLESTYCNHLAWKCYKSQASACNVWTWRNRGRYPVRFCCSQNFWFD